MLVSAKLGRAVIPAGAPLLALVVVERVAPQVVCLLVFAKQEQPTRLAVQVGPLVPIVLPKEKFVPTKPALPNPLVSVCLLLKPT
jgi:hypothetical protein